MQARLLEEQLSAALAFPLEALGFSPRPASCYGFDAEERSNALPVRRLHA